MDVLGRLRRARRWTQEQLAERAGVTGASVSRYEAGKLRPSGPVLDRLLTALGATDAEYKEALSSLPDHDHDPQEAVGIPGAVMRGEPALSAPGGAA